MIRINTILLLTLTVTTNACAQEGASTAGNAALGPARVAVVNGKPVPESVLRVYALSTVGRNLEELTPEERTRVLDELINVVLFTQQAEKDGLLASRTLAAQLELQRLQLVARAVASSYLEKNPATELELQQIYDDNLPRLSGQQYKARHILVETKDEAERVITQLRAGGDFVALARERADGPTGPNGGALDWFTADSMPKPFADAVRALTVGAYSTVPVQTEFGFHVILLEETRKQEPPAFADIRKELTDAAGRKRVEDYLKSLREAAKVSVGP